MTETPARPTQAPGPTLADQILDTARAVAQVRRGQSLTEVLEAVPAARRPGVQALAFTAWRRWGTTQALLKLWVPRPPPPDVDSLLRVALALLLETEAPPYPPHTLVHQAVEAAKQRHPRQAAMVNAVLRRAWRERGTCLQGVQERDPVARWNHPAWWIERLRADWPQQAEAILAASGRPAPMDLRVNRRKTTVGAYIEALSAAGLGAQALGAGDGIRLAQPCPVQRLPGFAEGWVSVQDRAAQRAAPLLLGDGLPTGARVLDACAAPGGKTAHLLERAELELLALDIDARRIQKVGANLQRLGLQAELKVADAARPDTWWDGRPFDAILLDAPCSASGIVRRQPDIPWLRRPGDIDTLAAQQARLLDALWPLLAPGGSLLYATCSVFRAEGRRGIDAFLQRTDGVRERPSPGHLLPLPDNALAAPGGDTVPGSDGFFYSLLERSTG